MHTQRRNLYILTFVLFVVMLGYGIIIPILPFYIEEMGAGGTELDTENTLNGQKSSPSGIIDRV